MGCDANAFPWWCIFTVVKHWDPWEVHSECGTAVKQKSFQSTAARGNVVGLARTGLIFTRIQKGAQPGGLTQPQPGQTEPGIPYHVPSCWVLVGGSWGGGTHSRLRSARRHFCPGERLCGSCGSCCVFSFSVSLLFLFPVFAVLLNCPYPDPPVSACFFLFSSAPRWGEGRPREAFVAGCSRTRTFIWRPSVGQG